MRTNLKRGEGQIVSLLMLKNASWIIVTNISKLEGTLNLICLLAQMSEQTYYFNPESWS